MCGVLRCDDSPQFFFLPIFLFALGTGTLAACRWVRKRVSERVSEWVITIVCVCVCVEYCNCVCVCMVWASLLVIPLSHEHHSFGFVARLFNARTFAVCWAQSAHTVSPLSHHLHLSLYSLSNLCGKLFHSHFCQRRLHQHRCRGAQLCSRHSCCGGFVFFVCFVAVCVFVSPHVHVQACVNQVSGGQPVFFFFPHWPLVSSTSIGVTLIIPQLLCRRMCCLWAKTKPRGRVWNGVPVWNSEF